MLARVHQWFGRRGPTFYLVWYSVLAVLAAATVVSNGVAPEKWSTHVLNAIVAGLALGYWMSDALMSLHRRHHQKITNMMPVDVSMHANDDGSITGVVHLGNGDLVGISIPDDLASEIDRDRPETTTLLAAYVFEQVVPEDVRRKIGAPTVADVRHSIELHQQNDDE